MTDPPAGPPRDPNDETGEPITVLLELGVEPSSGFLERVRHRLERRTLATQFLSLIWFVPAVVVLEFVNVLFESFGSRGAGRGGSP